MEYSDLHLETVTPLLSGILQYLMKEPLLESFRLVGGTNLSLRYGHRYSVDIDLFTDATYGSVDFPAIDEFFARSFRYCDYFSGPIGFGKMYYIGNSKEESVKVDLMYTEKFLDPEEYYGCVRMASPRDIGAMKMEAVFTGGRKKDIWDIDYLAEKVYSLDQMCNYHAQRHPYTHDRLKLLDLLTELEDMDNMSDPHCLIGKKWEEIKVNTYNRAEVSIDVYKKLIQKYGKEKTENTIEITNSIPLYSSRKYLGNLCQYSINGQIHSEVF